MKNEKFLLRAKGLLLLWPCLLFFAFAEGTLLLLPFEKDIAIVRNAPRERPRKGPFFLP